MVSSKLNRSFRSGKSAALVRFAKGISAFGADECGGEVLEYALIAGLIVVAAIATIGAVGTKVLGYWGSVNSSM
jgi:Flp pilus assembly pilin Flp